MIGIIIIILVALAFIFLFVSEKVFEKTNYFKKNYSETDKLKGKDKVDYVNTGSTFAFYGIDYESVRVKGLNLALRPQSLEADFNLLKHYEGRYNKGATVFLVISDLAFAKKGYSEAKTNEKYYKVLKANEIHGYSILKAFRAKYFPVLYHWKNFLRFHWDIKPDNEYELKVNENDQEAVEADAFIRCQSWINEFNLNNLNDASQAKRFKEEFEYTTGIVKEMVSWCEERRYKPIIVNLPVSGEMERSFSKEFLEAFYYNNVKRAGNVPFVDLQSNTRLSDYLLYLDSCRLNRAGREVITRILMQEAKKIQ